MTAISGIFNRIGTRPRPESVTRMLDAGIAWGCDQNACHHEGPIAFSAHVTHATSGRRIVPQPHRSLDGHVIVFAGRLDNRDELFERLGHRSDSSTSDPELVVSLYQAFGQSALPMLIGPFALGLWDPLRRGLLCARDFAGQCPMFYWECSGVFVFGTDMRQILAHPDFRASPNERVLGEYLSGELETDDETIYQGIRRLRGAESIWVDVDRAVRARFWCPPKGPLLDYRNPEDYQEVFRTTFEQVLSIQSRAEGPLGAQISGGLDSSTVAASVSAHAGIWEVNRTDLRAYSVVFPGWSCDESHFSEAVARKADIFRRAFEPWHQEAERNLAEDAARLGDIPDYPHATMHRSGLAWLKQEGVKSVLTGGGADEFWGGSLSHLADLVASGRIWPSWQQLRRDRASGSFVHPRLPWLRLAVLPLFPTAFRRALQAAARRKRGCPPLARDFSRKIGLDKRAIRPTGNVEFSERFQQEMWSDLVSPWSLQGNESGQRLLAEYGLEERSPFYDRRMVELAFRVPDAVRWWDGRPKFLIRSALGHRLPAAVRERNDKADFTPVIVRALGWAERRGELDVSRWAIAQNGWVQPQTVEDWRLRCLGDPSSRASGPALALWRALAVESWFKGCVGA